MLPLRPIPPVTLLGLFVSDEALSGNNPALIKHWWKQYEILQSIITLVIACLGGLAGWIVARRRGAPYREEERRWGDWGWTTKTLGDECLFEVPSPWYDGAKRKTDPAATAYFGRE